jgi:spore coat protein A, manganese oxidase
VREDRRFGRRSFLAAAGTGALAIAVPGGRRWPGLAVSRAAAPTPFSSELPIPELLTGSEVALDVVEAEIPILPGAPTPMWTYGGTFPGPTIRRPAGQQTQVTFSHSLPNEAGELTVHLHGGHTASEHDGQPGGPPAQPAGGFCDLSGADGDQESALLIEPGESRQYTYELTEDGGPERAAFQWYHDHRCHRTAENVWKGLAGMWIIDDDHDASLPLPRDGRDLPLMITDRSFKSNNELRDPFGDQEHPPDDGTTGNRVLVNGAYLPHHRVSGRRHRLRILNASLLRSYNLELSNGAPMWQIATESGLMPKAVKRNRVLVSPGERVELIVDFGDFPHRDVRLQSVRRRAPMHRSQQTHSGPLVEFRVGRRRPDETSVPEEPRPLPAWVAQAPSAPQKTWNVGISLLSWAINGKQYDPDYVEHTVASGTTETWRIRNNTVAAHAMHLHHTDWYMLERNGARPPAHERCLKETFLMNPSDEILVAGRFSDHHGKFVVHCHMLDHEDHGLMSQFEVVEP